VLYKDGQYHKQVGGDKGLVRRNGKWVRFDCIGCLYAMKLAVPSWRVVLPLRTFMIHFTWSPDMEIIRHDPSLHKTWLESGKPFRKE
jgi:hypothetical protein